MPQAIGIALLKIGFFVVELAAGAAAAAGLGAASAVAIGAAVVVGGAIVAKQAMSLFEVEMPTVDTDASRQRTVKSTTEPQKIIYGETLVSGPISFIGLSGTDNSDLYQTIVLAGHELTDITDIHMDDVVITDAQINSGSTAGGNVTGGTFGPKGSPSTTICVINKYRGLASQTADSLLTNAFGNYTSAHRGDGIAYLAMKWVLNDDSAETWDKFSPSNVKALVKGKSVFDPRTDTTVYSDNPALCLADYLTDTILGMGIPTSKIDWDAVEIAADGCDVSVAVPNSGTEKRFTCNGVLFATDSHQKNINKILSSMNGNLVYSNGKYIVHAGIYEAPTETLNEDDLIGAISIKTSLERSDRFNTIKGLFVDPAQNHKSSEFPKVQLADAVSRDNDEILEKEVQYPMTNSNYMAQRLSYKLIKLSDQQKVISFPANLSALRITAGDRVQVSIEELNWSNKVFQCAGWTFSEDGGVNLTLREDSSTSYADPTVTPDNEYSTITATGVITDAFRGVPSPSGLTVTPGLKSNELNWVNPGKTNDFGTIYVYASKNANFSSAIKIGETDGTQFVHDASNKSMIFFPSVVNLGDTYTIRTLGNTNFMAMGAASNTVGVVFTATATGSGTGNLWETIVPGDLRYYWVRAVKNIGTDDASRSGLEPPNDPNTTVFATVGAVEWVDVANPTIGIDINNSDEISINTGVANTTTGQAVAQSGISEDVTITQGGIRMNQGGSIRGGQTSYNSGEGFFLGYDSSKYKLSIRNSTSEALTFDGDDLTVTGTVNASAGEFSGQVAVGSTAGTITVIDGNDTDYRMFTNATLNTETNQYSPDDSSFKVGNDGRVFASNITIYNTDGDVLLSPTGLGAAALNDISASSGSVVSTVGGTVSNSTSEITLTTASASESFSITSKVALTANNDLTQYFNGASTSSTASALAQLTGVDVLVDYYVKPNGGSYSGTPSATQRVTIVSSGTPSSTQIRVGGFDRGASYSGSLTRYFSVLQDFGGALEAIPDSGGGATSYVITTASLASSLFPTAQTYKIKIVVRVVEDGTTTVISGSTTPPSSNNTTTGIYFDGGNSDERHYEITGLGLIKSSDNVFVSGSQNLLSSGGTISGDLVVTGDLTVQGTTTTINVADLTVADKDITLNYSTGDSSATANNAGIIIQDAVNSTTDASILWKTASDTFEFSHGVTWPSGSSANANTAYTYSQIGHLPLAGGTLTGNLAVNPSGTTVQITVGDNSQTSYSNLVLKAANGTGTQTAELFKGSDTYTNWGGVDAFNIYTSKGTINFHPAGSQDRFVVESARVYTENAYLLVGNNGTANSYDAVATGRIHFGALNSSTPEMYSIGVNAKENVGGNYTKLDIQWHTGVRIGANTTYGGTRFYNDAMSNSGVKIFSVGEGDDKVRVYYGLNVSGQTNLTDKLDVNKASADSIIDIRGNGDFDPVLNLGSDQGAITTEGFQIWYDNSVGDVHLHTTHPVAGASAIRFHTATGTDKATNNERFTIHGNGLVNIVSGNLAMGGSAVITNDRSLFPTSIEVLGSYSGGSGDYTNITNAQLKIGSAGSADFWRIPHFSQSATVSGVYNYQTGKNVYWGEPADTGTYFFRGRDLVIGDGVLKIGTDTVIDASKNLTNIRNITAAGVGTEPFSLTGNSTILFLNLGDATQTAYTGMRYTTDDGNAQFWKAGSGHSDWGGTEAFNIYNSNGPLAFHPSATQNVLKLTSTEIIAGKPIRVTGAGSANIYEGVIKTLNSSTDQWAHVVLGGSATNTIVNNYYMIGRGNSIAAREMTFHIPKAVNYGATDTTQPKYRFVSSGDVTLMTITAETGAVYIKGALSPSSISSGAITSTGALTLSADTTHVINLTAASASNSRGISFNSKVALSASQDGWLRLNQNSQFTNGVYTPLGLRADGGVDSYTGYKVLGTSVIDASRNFLGVGGSFSNNVYIAGTTANGLSIGETATNYASWDRQLTLNGTGHARMHVKTTAGIQMGMYAHDTWHNSGGGYLGTYTSNNVTFIINAVSAGYIDTSRRFTWQGQMLIGGEWSNNSYNVVSSTSLAFGGGNDLNNYSIGTAVENYGGNYTKLNLKWHTGIKFFAMSTYGGVRFFDNVAMTSEVMSIGKGDDHVRVANNLYVTGSLASTGANFTNTVNVTNTATAFAGVDIGSATQTQYSLFRLNSNNGNFQGWKAGTGYTGWGGASAMNIYTSAGDLCFHPAGTPNVLRINAAGLLTTGNVTAYYSDMRLKTKTAEIDNALEKVNSLSGFKYVENDLAKELGYSNDKQQVGLSAQQIQAVLPEAVSLAPIDIATDEHTGEIISKSGENYLTVDYAKLVPLLVEAIKELTQEVESLKTKLKEK